MEIVYFVVVIEVSLSASLGRGLLGFVRRYGSNDFWVFGVGKVIGVDFVACELCGTTIPVRRNTLTL